MVRLIPGALILAAACGGGLAVNTDYDPSASPRMGSFTSWNWLQHPGGRDGRADTTVAAEVAQAIERALTGLGYKKEEQTPEFRVGWHVPQGSALDITTINSHYGYAYGKWFPGGGVAYSRGFQTDYEPGTLIVDIAEARTNELIWRGIARGIYAENKNAVERAALLTEAVNRLFGQFPPGRATANRRLADSLDSKDQQRL